jgi:hypothetical protein
MMTILEWLGSKTRYTFDKSTLETIIYDRECIPTQDAYGGEITQRQKDLMIADTIFTAVMLSPSSSPSYSQSHNGYQKTVGSETDIFQSRKIDYALTIYKKYGDSKADILEGAINKIKFISIEDIDSI